MGSGKSAILKAAMKESMASGLLYECGWHLPVAKAKMAHLPTVLIDPITGCGKFCIKAALMRAASKALQDNVTFWQWYNRRTVILHYGDICAKKLKCTDRRAYTGEESSHREQKYLVLGNDTHKEVYRLALRCRQSIIVD